jgi:hypothetical protein
MEVVQYRPFASGLIAVSVGVTFLVALVVPRCILKVGFDALAGTMYRIAVLPFNRKGMLPFNFNGVIFLIGVILLTGVICAESPAHSSIRQTSKNNFFMFSF